MRRKKQVAEFLNSNYTMINSLMSAEEKRTFNGDVVKIILDETKKQISESEGGK